MRTALTIAGSDSGGGAGVQADLKTFAAHGVYGASAITAITAQNSRGITALESISADLVTAQIEAIAADFSIDAVKTGMLPTAAIVEAVGAAVRALELPLLVVDPVMSSTSGHTLTGDEAVAAMRTELLPHAAVVTPNIPEAAALAGIAIVSDADRREAARRIAAHGPRAVIIKGGHIDGASIIDLLFERGTFTEFRTERIDGAATHGTGCTFAAALAAHLALGDSLAAAIPQIQMYIAGAIRHAPGLGQGNGPMAHLWNLVEREAPG